MGLKIGWTPESRAGAAAARSERKVVAEKVKSPMARKEMGEKFGTGKLTVAGAEACRNDMTESLVESDYDVSVAEVYTTGAWEISSKETNSLALQKAVADRFGYGTGEGELEKLALDKAYKESGLNKKALDKYVAFEYEASQHVLDRVYPDQDEITLWRGASSKLKGEREYRLGTLSSWTDNLEMAKRFAVEKGDSILETKVPKKRIFNAYNAERAESEFLVLGNRNVKARAIASF